MSSTRHKLSWRCTRVLMYPRLAYITRGPARAHACAVKTSRQLAYAPFSSPLSLSPWRTKFSLIASRLLVRFDGHPIFPSHFRIERNKMEWNYTSISLSLEFNYSIRNFWSNCNIILFDDTFSNIYIYVKCLNLTSTLSKYVSTSLSDSRSSVPTINPLTPRAHIPSHHPSHPSKSPVRTYITTPVCGTTYGQL